MLRSSLIAAGALLLCSAGFAQKTFDPTRMGRVVQPILDGGMYNVTTHKWVSSNHNAAHRGLPYPYAVYDNTCTWAGGIGYYWVQNGCFDNVDEGRIPGGVQSPSVLQPDDNLPFGATVDNAINTVFFTWCTDNAANPAKIMEIDFFNNLGGNCMGGLFGISGPLPTFIPAPPPFSPWVTVPGLANAIAFNGLPGDILSAPGDGNATCYIFGASSGNAAFMCLQSDGDGVYDNLDDLDDFSWVFQTDTTEPFADGLLLSGEPSLGPGSCTYGNPCAFDPISTTVQCGSGLDTGDLWWWNFDANSWFCNGPGVGCAPYGVAGCTGCYWFGGWPANPLASFYLRLESLGSCAGCDGAPVALCAPLQPDVTDGCTPTTAWAGTPDVSQCNTAGPSDFVVTFGNMSENKNANTVLAKGQASPGPWSAQSTKCFVAPFARGPYPSTGGTGAGCTGSIVFDCEAFLQGGGVVAPAAAGDCYVAQGWYRDPASNKTTQLTGAVAFYICP